MLGPDPDSLWTGWKVGLCEKRALIKNGRQLLCKELSQAEAGSP